MYRKYSSIENADANGYLGKVKAYGLDIGEWIVQEKAHGANLSFRTDDGEHWAAGKRTALLPADERFYSHQELLAAHLDRLRELYRLVREKVPDATGSLVVFGEVIGGDYPGVKNALYPKVQKGVFYVPDHRFYAFDILVGGADYLPVDLANELFKTTGIVYAKSLFRGSLAEALEYPNDFSSTIPELYGFNAINDNVAEGTIIRPVDGRRDRHGDRVMFKHKNAKWAERAAKRDRAAKAPLKLSEGAQSAVDTALEYVTDARVAGVAGQLGELTRKDFGRLLGTAAKDAYEDFMKSHAELLLPLEKVEKKAVSKAISNATAPLVRRYFEQG